MSNSLVKFMNIKNLEVDLDRNCKISIEYIVDKGVTVSHSDWIAIYPQGADLWNSVRLDLMVAYEFALIGPMRKGDRRYKMDFSLKGANNVKYGHNYQFVYISRSSEIYGISEAFEIRPPALNEISDKSNSPQSDEIGKENTEDNTTQGDSKKRKAKRRTKVESDKSETEDKGGAGDRNVNEANKFINKFKKNKQMFAKKQNETCPSNSCSIHRMSPPISCSNCYRVAGLLRAQEELYNKIKNLAEINNDLRNQVGLLQRRAELSQAACQKLSVTLMRERHAKQFYQAAAFERADYEYQIMVVPGVFAPTSRHSVVPDRLDRPRGEDRGRGCSALKLKAIIGSQEGKIRNLTEEVARLKMEERRDTTTVASEEEVTTEGRTTEENEGIKEDGSSSNNEN